MTIYYVLYLSLTIGAAIRRPYIKTNRSNKLFCIYAFVLIASVLALRHPSMGIDLAYGTAYGYLGTFNSIGNSSWQFIFKHSFLNYEKGYVIFCKLLSYVSSDPQILLIACAIASIAAFSWLICKYSDNCLISFVVLMGLPVFLTNFSAMRQVLAIAITVISYKYICENKPISFILGILLAATFHRSAFFFLIAYPVYHLRLNKGVRMLLAGVLPIIFFLRYPLFSVMSKLLKNDAVPDRNNALTLFVVFSALYIFSVLYSDNRENNGLCNLFWLACICQAFGGVYSTAMRMGYYFMVYLILLLPKNLSYMKKNLHDSNCTYLIFSIVIYNAFFAFGLYSLYSTYWSMSYPYHFFWQSIR